MSLLNLATGKSVTAIRRLAKEGVIASGKREPAGAYVPAIRCETGYSGRPARPSASHCALP